MTPGVNARVCFRLPRLYGPYQLVFGAAQVLSALVVTALTIHTPYVTRASLAVLLPVLAIGSLCIRGPLEKVGLVIEAERLVVAGRVIPFIEIVRVLHSHSWGSGDEQSSCVVHAWTLRLRLLTGSDVTLSTYHCSRPEQDPDPPPEDPYAHLAREIRRAHGLWLRSLTPSALQNLRDDLLQFRRYNPGPARWQAAVASPAFSLVALGAAAAASMSLVAWLK